jgi:hypothetical protein
VNKKKVGLAESGSCREEIEETFVIEQANKRSKVNPKPSAIMTVFNDLSVLART